MGAILDRLVTNGAEPAARLVVERIFKRVAKRHGQTVQEQDAVSGKGRRVLDNAAKVERPACPAFSARRAQAAPIYHLPVPERRAQLLEQLAFAAELSTRTVAAGHDRAAIALHIAPTRGALKALRAALARSSVQEWRQARATGSRFWPATPR